MKKQLTRKEKLELIDGCISLYKSTNETWDDFEKITMASPESPLFNSIWRIFEKYVDMLSKLIDDDFNWLSWYIYENDCGKNELEAKNSSQKKMHKIKNTKQLLNLIEE